MNLLARHVIFRALLRWTAAVAFCVPLKHRSHARLRALGMLLPLLGLRGDTAIQISGYLARLVSSPLNFVLNRNFVFKFKQDTGKTALKYALLCIVTITLSNLGVSLLDHLHIFIGGFAFIPKILMDTLLYLVNYRIQNKWIFAKSAENQEG